MFGYSEPCIFVIGTGGTGGYLIAYLTRLLSTLTHTPHLIICDGDSVAEHNLHRQNFIPQDLNKNKAQVLSERYNNIYNLQTAYLDEFIEDTEKLTNLFPLNSRYYPVVIGCVDNNKTRQLLHEVFEKTDTILYIDSGNDDETGQVVAGVKISGKEILPPVGKIYPNILSDTDSVFKSEESCSRDENAVIQSMPANITAAGIIFSYLYALLKSKSLCASHTTFNALFPNVRSVEFSHQVEPPF